MRLALLLFIVWIASGVVFYHFHECKCPASTAAIKGDE